MVDSCRQLTISQSNGDEDTAGMVTILTGHQVEELCTRSAAMKVSSHSLFQLLQLALYHVFPLFCCTCWLFYLCLFEPKKKKNSNLPETEMLQMLSS